MARPRGYGRCPSLVWVGPLGRGDDGEVEGMWVWVGPLGRWDDGDVWRTWGVAPSYHILAPLGREG